MLHKPHIRRGWYSTTTGLFLLTLALSVPDLLRAVDSPVVQGTVKTTANVGIANATVELHTPDGNFNVNTTTNSSGAFTISATLAAGTNYVVEVREISGYNRNEPHAYNFTYQSGDAIRTYDFTFTQASKTISGRVTNTNGNPITDADVNADPYNNIAASRSTDRTDASGNYSITVLGGTWFAQAVVNLSEYTPRWIAEQPPVRIDFANDSTSETQTVNFVVTPATGKVTAQLLNSNGAALTSSNFVADIDFRRADGVGTARKVQQSDSSLSVYLTPGIYGICAFHPDLQGKSFDPAATTFVMTDNGNVDLGTVQAEVNGAHLKGKVVDSAGKGIANVALMAVREAGCDRPQGSTQSDGTFDLTVGAGTWTIGLNSTDPQYSQVAPVSATVTNNQTADGLNITLKVIDRTITGNVVNSSGAKLIDYVGSAFVQSSSKGTKVYAPVIDGTFTIKYSSSDVPGSNVVIGAEATEGSAYTGSAKTKVTVAGSTTSKNVTVLTFDATLSGTLLLPAGTAVTNAGSDITVEAVDENGNFASADVAANGTYSLPLAKGIWLFDYNIEHPELTAGLLNRPAGQNQVTMSSGKTVTKNLTVRKGTNIITGTVKNSGGVAVARALVNLDNRPKLEDSSSSKPEDMVSLTTETNESGVYTVLVPDGTYLVTVGDTPAVAETQLPPDAKVVKVSGAKTATANLSFEASNATIKGKVTSGGKTDGGGIVNAWTDDGASVSAPVKKDGTYTLSVTAGETWHVEVTDLKGNKLMESDAKDIKAKAGSNTANLSMADAGVTVPGPVTKSCASDETCAVSTPDGASITLPPFAADLSGSIKVTIAPTIDLNKTSTDAPATLAYEVKVLNNSGNEVADLFKPAEVTIPYTQNELADNGLVEKRLTPTAFNPDTKTWEDSGVTGLVDAKNNVATIKTEHLTKFSVTGTAKKAPKISGFKVKQSNKTSLVIEISGSNFTGKPTATFGSAKASNVTLKNGVLTITVPSKNVKKGSQTLTITNGNGRTVTVTKSVTVTNGTPKVK